METISLMAAVTLTGKSRRTLWRRLSDGSLARGPDDAQGRTMLLLDAVKAMAPMPLHDDDWRLVQAADAGDAQAQNDLALLFLAAANAEAALYWLELAVAKDHPDALHWLARCHIAGNGVAANKHRGLMYLAQSAALGHAISRAQVDRLTVSRTGPSAGSSASG